MAPAPTATANRPMARPSKIRYFKGKAPEAAGLSDESDEDGEEQTLKAQQPTKTKTQVDESLVAGGAGRIFVPGRPAKQEVSEVKMDLGGVKLGVGKPMAPKIEEESSEEEESDEEEEEEAKPAVRVPKPPGDESSEYETDSEDESEEEKKPAFRPVFVRKDNRGMTQEKIAAEAEAKLKLEEEMQAQRKLDSKELAGETIRRELAEREANDIQPDIDDTDGLDPAGEFDAWRARELARLLRDKQAQAAADEEREEIERRRAMPEEQRLREDMEYAQKTREREKGQMGFMQKYYHKGAFHQDDELLNRDYTEATQSQVDVSLLPKVMQVRDFGKMSRTKYTHLADQDTSQGGWGAAARPTGPGTIGTTDTGCWNCGGPHLRQDCPNNNLSDANNPFASVPGAAGLSAAGAGAGGHARGGYGGVGSGGGGPGTYGTSANTAALGTSSRTWGAGGQGGQRDDGARAGAGGGAGAGAGAQRYREEGRERRFDEERRNGGSSTYGHRDREGDGKSNLEARGNAAREGERERDRRHGSERDRDRDRDRDRTREGDRDRRHRDERSQSPRRRDDESRRKERERPQGGDRDNDRERERERHRFREREGERDRHRDRDRRR